MNTLMFIFSIMTVNFDLPPGLLKAVCTVESKLDITAVHYADGKGNSLGVCQIKYKTAQFMGFKGTEQQLMKPRVNAYYAAKYVRYQLNRYGNINQALVAYNIGNSKNKTESKYSRRVINEWSDDCRNPFGFAQGVFKTAAGGVNREWGQQSFKSKTDWDEIRRIKTRALFIKHDCHPQDKSCADLRQIEIRSFQLAQGVSIQPPYIGYPQAHFCLVRRRKFGSRNRYFSPSTRGSKFDVFA